MNALIIADTHIPFEHKKYLPFCKRTRDRFHCDKIFHAGDAIDNHAISYHEHNPDGMSPREEMELAEKKLQRWYKAFPRVDLCRGNHDELVSRKAVTHGLSRRVFKPYRSVWKLPKGWNYQESYQWKGIKITHGTGYSGKYPHVNCANANRQSTVIGHCHSIAGVHWGASDHDLIFALAVGCGINRRSYAFDYGKYLRNKPILGCGVIKNNGEQALFVPMEM